MREGRNLKKVILYILIFICFCGLIELSVNYSLGQQIENQSPYCLSFSSIGANLLESRIDSWAKIKTTSSAKQLDQHLITILEKLQLPINNYKFKHTSDNTINSLEYECQKSTATFQFILQSDKNQKETYILISIIAKPNSNSINLPNYEKKLKQVLDFNCYYLYSGYIDYNLEPASRLEFLKLILKQMDAKQVDLYEENNTTSITGFSENLAGNVKPIDTGLHKVNLQAAMRCNRIENRTYVYIGSPVILGEY
jgi:hypothetical protein